MLLTGIILTNRVQKGRKLSSLFSTLFEKRIRESFNLLSAGTTNVDIRQVKLGLLLIKRGDNSLREAFKVWRCQCNKEFEEKSLLTCGLFKILAKKQHIEIAGIFKRSKDQTRKLDVIKR